MSINNLELVKKVIEMTGNKSRIILMVLPIDGPIQRKPENTLSKKYLDWQPGIELQAGLEKTINYFKTKN